MMCGCHGMNGISTMCEEVITKVCAGQAGLYGIAERAVSFARFEWSNERQCLACRAIE